MKLTPKQEKFCLEYTQSGNASDAYRRVYDASKMKDSTIGRKAKELLDNGKISARVEELRAKFEKKAEWSYINTIEALIEVVEIGLGKKPSKHMVIEGMGDGMTQTIEVELCDTNLPAVNTAVRTLAQIQGYLTKKVEHTGTIDLKTFVENRYKALQGKQDG